MKATALAVTAMLGILSLTAFAQQYATGFGPNPTLPAPEHSLVPTVNEAPVQPWPQGTHPTPAAGLAAAAYATKLDHPRWPFVLPNGGVLVAKAIAPDHALGNHTASLGMTFYDAKDGALVSQHGSWNRKPFAGYKLIYVPFTNGKPSGPSQDVLTGFLSQDGHVYGRPVGVAVDKSGAILLAGK